MTLDSFTEMAEKVHAKALTYLTKLKLSSTDAEDCLQDSFRQLLTRLEDFHSEDQVSHYLTENIKGRLRNVYRKRMQHEAGKREYGYGLDSKRHRPQEFLNWRMDLEKAAQRAVGQVGPGDVQGIPTRYRGQSVKALLIHVYAGISLDDLAEELVTPERSLATWVSSLLEAKRRLRREMRKGGYGGLR